MRESDLKILIPMLLEQNAQGCMRLFSMCFLQETGNSRGSGPGEFSPVCMWGEASHCSPAMGRDLATCPQLI